MRFKALLGLILSIISVFTITATPASAAYTKYNCSDIYTACRGVTMTSPQAATVESYGMYIPAGTSVLYQGWTESNSLFNMSFWIVDSSGKTVSPVRNAPQFGSDWWG